MEYKENHDEEMNELQGNADVQEILQEESEVQNAAEHTEEIEAAAMNEETPQDTIDAQSEETNETSVNFVMQNETEPAINEIDDSPISDVEAATIEDDFSEMDQQEQDIAETEFEEVRDQNAATLSTLPFQPDDTNMDADNTSASGPASHPKHKKAKTTSFFKQHRTASIVASCFALAVAGGFGGTLLAMNISGQSGKSVLYQAVDKGSGSGSSDATSMSVKDVANETMNSVVEIKTESVTTNEYFQQAVTSGAGSGVILSKDGYIVTNNHVIENASKITVTTKDGKEYAATLIGTDSTTDLAVIKIEANDLTPAVLGESGKLEVGDTAIAIGNPLGSLGGTVTTGIISALDREITIDNETMHLLQTNAAINPGNSGGGLFNANGELIGIVNAKSSGNNIEGLGFAIPIDIAKPIITSLMENGKVTGRAELGVSLVEMAEQANPFENNNNEGKTNVYINSVQEGKAADNAGLKRGDKILEVDGKEVSAVADVKTAVSSHKAGETMSIKIERNGEEQTVSVKLLESSNATTQKTNYLNNNSNSVSF